ncbi:MAG: phosphatase PAP2 family protein [Humidesulfovibrio sp.]|nr:phosphatase PAP2 family protein [Humidesulfovibrio sp.]
MPSRSPSPLAVWTALCLPLLLVVAGTFAFLGSESAVTAFFDAWRAANPAATRLVRFYTDWGNPALYLVYAAMLYRGLKRGRADLTGRVLAYLAAQLLVSLALERVLKIGIGRPRPDVGGPFRPFSLDAAHNSMPSGHTVEMTVQTSSLALFARSLVLPSALGLALALIGLSRMVLGAHHPTDVLGGLIVGSLGGLVAQRLAPRFAERLRPLLARFRDTAQRPANKGTR